jgi:phosphatidylglycerophosphatase A
MIGGMFIHPENTKILSRLDLKQPYVWLATWLGSGFLTPGPGTWGSLASIPFALIAWHLFGLPGFIIGLILISAVGYYAADKFTKALGVEDSPLIVIDEAAGQWIVLLPVLYFSGFHPVMIALAFLFFRVLDIAKPWPISWLDRNLKGAAGVMADDILAGLAAGLLITGIHYAGFG